MLLLYRLLRLLSTNKYWMIHCFGCSFTRYLWPSWADLLQPTRPALNWGIPGLGNRAIFTRIWQAVREGLITPNDQVIVQWSSPLRYDLKRQGRWDQNGNVWNQELNPHNSQFLKHYWDDQDSELQTVTWVTALAELLSSRGIPTAYTYMQSLRGPAQDEHGRPRQAQNNWQVSCPEWPVWDLWLRQERRQAQPIQWTRNPFNDRVRPYTDLHPEPREAGEYIVRHMREWLELTDQDCASITQRAEQAQCQLREFHTIRDQHPFEYYKDRKDSLCFVPETWPRKWADTHI